MNKKIALMCDSCTDVPTNVLKEYGIFVIPTLINCSKGEFRDGIDIDAAGIENILKTETPKTAIPSPGEIADTVSEIVAAGYSQLIAVTISSGLSGLNNAVNLALKGFSGLESFVFDTKNIAIGAGFSVILAAEMIAAGKEFSEICSALKNGIKKSKVFFSVNTLEYLRKGGRIGLVSSLLGTALNLKPVISCNDDGVYYTVSKTRGRKQSIDLMISEAAEFLKGATRYNISIVHGCAKQEATNLFNTLRNLLPNYESIFEVCVGSSLFVHTGPGLIGIGVQIVDSTC